MLNPAAALLSVIPLRARGRTVIAAALFHAWGFAHLALGLALSSTCVLHRRFDPEATLSLAARHRADALVVVPVMLQRILELPAEILPLRPLGPARRHIATPRDLREAPGTAGRPPRITVARLLGEDGRPVPDGATGRIYVGDDMQFEGYTGGGSKDVLDGLTPSGDVGHFDAAGRLFVDGRDDDMIVSSGENGFPGEVEDLLAGHDAIAEAAVFGVRDDRFGQRLKAVVVRRAGHAIDEGEVKAYVKANLAAYKAPREVAFVDGLPRTSTGKVLKRELRDPGEDARPAS